MFGITLTRPKRPHEQRLIKLYCHKCGRFIGFLRRADLSAPELFPSADDCCVLSLEEAVEEIEAEAPPERTTNVSSPPDLLDEGHYQGYGAWESHVRRYEDLSANSIPVRDQRS